MVPVISPLPLRVNQAAKTASLLDLAAGMNGGDSGADGTFADYEFAVRRR